ncbi:MAG: hypothetical protein DLM53_12775 [Candidatus Eremiobacter antarcticus]|nr:hypothetical protein [Candidatus Eremiobacteraeota bacterium]MBC5807660.1 hypothetical protein [Candidatus Eremiobacteraeota bacterium]PZR60512.1 MAG: hypothetical protein DLM53_12775 [Candidatus Eremiobacter sp. RRmetagenome_bin22]
MRSKAELDAYVRPRWSSWLKLRIDDYKLNATGLARLMATDPDDPYTYPRAAVSAFLGGRRTVTADVAFRIGECFQERATQIGIADNVCGPVAVWAAGRYPALIQFLGNLAAQPAPAHKSRLGPPAYHAVILYAALWASDREIGPSSHPRAAADIDAKRYVDDQASKAARLLHNVVTAPGARELYRSTWLAKDCGHERIRSAARIAQSTPPDDGMDAAWRFMQPWAQTADPNTFGHGAQLLDAWNLSRTKYLERTIVPNDRKRQS